MTTQRIAVFPGSFDPLTNGHVDVIERCLEIFGKVAVAVLSNPSKATLFTVEERTQLICEQFRRNRRVQVLSFSGLLVDVVKRLKTKVIIRGLRAITDYEYEVQMALMNRQLSPQVETLFLVAREEHSYISSTIVKQVAALGGDVRRLVPLNVLRALKARLPEKRQHA